MDELIDATKRQLTYPLVLVSERPEIWIAADQIAEIHRIKPQEEEPLGPNLRVFTRGGNAFLGYHYQPNGVAIRVNQAIGMTNDQAANSTVEFKTKG